MSLFVPENIVPDNYLLKYFGFLNNDFKIKNNQKKNLKLDDGFKINVYF